MNRRARRVTMAAALAGAGVLAALGVLYADAVREELERFRIRLAGGIVILPAPGSRAGEVVDIDAGDIKVVDLLRFIADSTSRAIIVDAVQRKCLGNTITLATRMNDVSAAVGMMILEANRFGFAERTFRRGSHVLTSREPICALDEPTEGGLWLVAPLPQETR